MQLAAADDEPIHPAGDLLEDGGVGRQRLARLVDVGQLDRRPDRQVPASGFSSPTIILNSVVLPAPLGR